MKTIKLVCIRHGESLGNVDKSVYESIPDFKVPLTAKGEQQASALGKTLAASHDIKTSSILALCIGIGLIVAGVILIKDDLDEY